MQRICIHLRMYCITLCLEYVGEKFITVCTLGSYSDASFGNDCLEMIEILN